jgi:AAA+ superfamily predicted ATPase
LQLASKTAINRNSDLILSYLIHIYLSIFTNHPDASRAAQASRVQLVTQAETFHAMGISWAPRSLLHGPPGSGKTQLLKWLEKQVADGLGKVG